MTGLTPPSEADREAAARVPGSPRASRGRLAVVLQLVGFIAALGIFGWCVMQAFSEQNRAQLARLGEADPMLVAAMLGLSAGVLIVNGLIFWVVLLPERRLPALDVLATNAIATFVAYVPFKLSLAVRLAVHNRRDGVPLLTIAGWFAAIGVLMLAVIGPLAAASLWRGSLDTWWWVTAAGGVVLLVGLAIGCAEVFARERGRGRLLRVLRPIAVGPIARLLSGDGFAKLHAGLGMLAHVKASIIATLLRLIDLALQAARFAVAAQILGVDLRLEQAVLLATTHFAIGVLSPFGMLGSREAGTVGIAALIGLSGEDSVLVMTLFVTGTESVVYLLGAVLGMVRLRAHRLLLRRGKAADGVA